MSDLHTGLFVVSDVHGHLDDLRRGLVDAGLVDADGAWAGGEAELWMLGDLVDRGPDGIGVIDLMMSLQRQAPDRVHVLMGNHEALALGQKLFPGSSFADVWALNGGQARDQDALTDDHVAWLRGLPLMGRVGDFLLMHSDTTAYLSWGESVDSVNATVSGLLASEDAAAHWDVFARLTSRYHFTGAEGGDVATGVLSTFGGECVVHGHTIIGSLTGTPSPEVTGPVLYADGLVLAIDGGRYDGGPLLLVRLD
ncbi:MAG: metallophosphoesterase family protein [Nocardioidaceae bacterium]